MGYSDKTQLPDKLCVISLRRKVCSEWADEMSCYKYWL